MKCLQKYFQIHCQKEPLFIRYESQLSTQPTRTHSPGLSWPPLLASPKYEISLYGKFLVANKSSTFVSVDFNKVKKIAEFTATTEHFHTGGCLNCVDQYVSPSHLGHMTRLVHFLTKVCSVRNTKARLGANYHCFIPTTRRTFLSLSIALPRFVFRSLCFVSTLFVQSPPPHPLLSFLTNPISNRCAASALGFPFRWAN